MDSGNLEYLMPNVVSQESYISKQLFHIGFNHRSTKVSTLFLHCKYLL